MHPMRSCTRCRTVCDADHRFCHACGTPLAGSSSTNAASDPLIGRTLPGGYRLLHLIGVGGMGRVYRAEQSELGRTVAVKIIHPHLHADAGIAARFLTEARAASVLNHPNCIGVFDFGRTEDGWPYLVMPLLRGRDLARVAYEDGPLAIPRALAIVRQILAALAEAHHHGIVHRDLKPENVIVERDRSGRDFVKVVDFGLAKVRSGAPRAAKRERGVTVPGTVCGTPDYMAPEQARGETIDGRADLYAVGVVLYQLLTGKLPAPREVETSPRRRDAVRDPRDVAPERAIPEAVAHLTIRALAHAPESRWPDADAFGAAVETALADLEAARRGDGPSLACAACATLAPPSQRFCGECGERLPVPEAAAPPPVRPRSAAPVGLPLPFVGRGDDLAWLRDRRSEARTAAAGALIVGEPGVGKTRLVRDFARACAARGDLVVRTRPDPWWSRVGYFSLRRAVCGLASIDPRGEEAEWVGATPEARRGLQELFGRVDPTSGGISPDERRWVAAEALRWALTRAALHAGDRSIVLAVDDLDRIDGASLHAFGDVLADPPLVRALVVGVHAPGFAPPWPDDVPSRALAGISHEIGARLLAGAVRTSDPGDGRRELAPLHLEHLLRFASESGNEAPARLVDLLALRLERLGGQARQLLQALAILGDDVSIREIGALVPEGPMLRTATGSVEPAIARAVDQLVEAGMLETSERGLRYAHPLLREIATATIPAGVRAELHGRAARLAAAQALPLEVRAAHAVLADDETDGLLLTERVAEIALARGDAESAVTALAPAVELARKKAAQGRIDESAALIFGRKLGEALAAGERWDDAERVLREAIAGATAAGSERGKLLHALATLAHRRHRAAEAARWLEAAFADATGSGSHELVASIEDARRTWAS